MKKGLFSVVLACICAMACMFGLVACNDEEGTTAVESVTLNKTELTLEVGGEETLTVTVAPDDATDKTVTWTSDNTAIATVENGKVTAVAAGNATITAKAGDKTASCSVTVNAAITYTVTEEEWNEALDLKYKNLTFTGTVNVGGESGEMTLKLIEDGSIHQISSGVIDWGEHIYRVNSDKTVSYFSKTETGWEAGPGGTGYDTLQEYEQGNYGDDFGFMRSIIPSVKYNSLFEYDETDNSYKGTVNLNISSDGALAFDTTVKFENKNLVFLDFSADIEGVSYVLTVRLYDYGTTEITFPTV